MSRYDKYRSKLDACMRDAASGAPPVPPGTGAQIDKIVEAGHKAAISVALTSLLKKAVDPRQDVRRHQAKMRGGYSGRGLDQNVTTPFLQENNFPAMAESGWLTRSFEQNAAYDRRYPGAIAKCKKEFLGVLDAVECGGADATPLIVYFLQRLSEKREAHALQLAVPKNLTVQDAAAVLDEHFSAQYGARGAARLPTLAIYAIYRQMLAEVGRYRNCTLGELRPHTAADRRTGSLGDIEVLSGKGDAFEAIEVKHGQAVTGQMVRSAFDKFKSMQGPERYYILTTSKGGDDTEGVTRAAVEISRVHGCQVIVNGVIESLKYYLRLLRTTDEFVQNYVELLADDPAVAYEHRKEWNRIVGRLSRGTSA